MTLCVATIAVSNSSTLFDFFEFTLLWKTTSLLFLRSHGSKSFPIYPMPICTKSSINNYDRFTIARSQDHFEELIRIRNPSSPGCVYGQYLVGIHVNCGPQITGLTFNLQDSLIYCYKPPNPSGRPKEGREPVGTDKLVLPPLRLP
jgi:hypothetical protein